ncbi:glutelin type-A 2 [Coffea arabica]|uniref:Glutelin type-A 2 n=1 Tax=Coffea arabica TaxID=13443 RepID=A0A6P6WDJ2_COFAR
MASVNLAPQFTDVTIFEGEGGGYYTWSASLFPLLSEAKLGAGKLVLRPRGFALPHYADCHKIGYFVQGSGRVGIVLPNSPKEVVLAPKKGDAIPVPLGSVSWWYNAGEDNSDVEIVFLGETAQTYTPAQFDYFFLAGVQGVLGGFSTDFITRAFDLTQDESDQLLKSQTGSLIVKLAKNQTLPDPCKDANINMLYNFESAKPSIHVNQGGSLTIATAENFPFLKKVGLSANFAKLDPFSMSTPMYTADASFQLIFITKGSGVVEIAGLNGKNALAAKVQSGQLCVVPKFLPVAKIADEEGLEYFCVVTSLAPYFAELAGETTVWKAMDPSVLQSAFNVDPGLVELFNTKIGKGKLFCSFKEMS